VNLFIAYIFVIFGRFNVVIVVAVVAAAAAVFQKE